MFRAALVVARPPHRKLPLSESETVMVYVSSTAGACHCTLAVYGEPVTPLSSDAKDPPDALQVVRSARMV